MKVSGETDQPLHIAYFAPELGALTSTFIYREVAALRNRGVSISLFSTSRPSETRISSEAEPIVAETEYLYDAQPIGVAAGALGYGVRHPLRFMRTLALAVRDAFAAKTPGFSDRVKMLWHFVAGCRLAALLEADGAQHVHAHFAHVPAAIAMYAANLAGIPFSFTAHANDIFERATALKESSRRITSVSWRRWGVRRRESVLFTAAWTPGVTNTARAEPATLPHSSFPWDGSWRRKGFTFSWKHFVS